MLTERLKNAVINILLDPPYVPPHLGDIIVTLKENAIGAAMLCKLGISKGCSNTNLEPA